MTGELTPRAQRTRSAIVVAATQVFAEHGYLGATTDEVAARSFVSKQTLYKHFADKQTLFAEVVLAATKTLAEGFQSTADSLGEPTDVRAALRHMADGFLGPLMRPDVIRLRRLVIAEADRFPKVAQAWYDLALHRSLVIVGEGFERLQARGLLRNVADPTMAAYQFAGMLLYLPQNRVMFAGTDAAVSKRELKHILDSAIEVFLAAYGAD